MKRPSLPSSLSWAEISWPISAKLPTQSIIFNLEHDHHVREYVYGQCNFPSSFPSILATISFRLLHGIYSLVTEEFIQGIKTLFTFLNLPNHPGAPNSTRRHTSPDLPPQDITDKTEMSTVYPMLSSLTFVLTLSQDELCADYAEHAILRHEIEFINRFRRPR
jgi:hypothetical protein